jgi:hypothetical protein
MKKLLLISTLAVASTLSSFGQGHVGFANTSTSPVRRADGTAVPTGLSGGTYLAELLYAVDGATTDAREFGNVATRVGATTTFNTPTAGVFNGGGRTITSITPPGGFGMFQVRVWDTRAGADYAAALASGNSAYQAGYSAVVRVDTADSTASPLPPAASLGLASFTLSPIPEPSVVALGLLGAGALLMLRRRK